MEEIPLKVRDSKHFSADDREPLLVNNHAQIEGQIQALSETLAQNLGRRISATELARARLSLTEEEALLTGSGQSLEKTKAIQDFCVAFGLEQAASELLRAAGRIADLLIRICKRHLNSIKVEPPPATLASRTLENLLELSKLFSPQDSHHRHGTLAATIEELSRCYGQGMRELLEKDALTIAELDEGFTREHEGLLRVAGHGLAEETTFLDGLLNLLEVGMESYLRALAPHPSEGSRSWARLSRRDALSTPWLEAEELLSSAPVSNRAFERQLELCDLITGHFSRFSLHLNGAIEATHERIDRLEKCDATLFARQFKAPHLKAENTIFVRALSHRLRTLGENVDDIEAFAKKLMAYGTEHDTLCSAVLDSEILELAASLSSLSVTSALRHVKYVDLDCPLSVAHKNRILEIVAEGEKALAPFKSTGESQTPSAKTARGEERQHESSSPLAPRDQSHGSPERADGDGASGG